MLLWFSEDERTSFKSKIYAFTTGHIC